MTEKKRKADGEKRKDDGGKRKGDGEKRKGDGGKRKGDGGKRKGDGGKRKDDGGKRKDDGEKRKGDCPCCHARPRSGIQGLFFRNKKRKATTLDPRACPEHSRRVRKDDREKT